MTTLIKTTTALTAVGLTTLQADPVLNAGNLFVYDALDVSSWPEQDGAEAADTIIDLAGNANATVGSAALGWDDGWVWTGSNTNQRITLPASADLESDVEAFAIAAWITLDDVTGSTKTLISNAKSGSGYTNTQYIVFYTGSVLKLYGMGQQIGSDVAITNGTHHIGISIEKSGSGYLYQLWLDGVSVTSETVTGSMADALTASPMVGFSDIFGSSSPDMTLHRLSADDLSIWSAETFILEDFTARAERF